jgi:hypothetical protein
LLKLLFVFAKVVIIAFVFEKNAKFFAENWQKSQKITSTPSATLKVGSKISKVLSFSARKNIEKFKHGIISKTKLNFSV